MSLENARRRLRPTFAKRVVRAIKRRTVGESPVYWHYNRMPRRAGEIWFTPGYPHHPLYAIYKITAKLGLGIARERSSRTRAVFSWNDATFCDPVDANGLKVVNGSCVDISKQAVEREFERAFGYSLAVDPMTFSGRAICKTNENALHRGSVIECPIIEKDPNASYEVFVDSHIDNEFFEELRIPIIGDEIPLIYLKLNPHARRFENWMTGCALIEDVESAFSRNEALATLKMLRSLGLDCGEVDALRDRHTGKLYIVDVNKTPAGPPSALTIREKVRAVDLLAASFSRTIE